MLFGEGNPFRGEECYGFHLGSLQLMRPAYGKPKERKVRVFDPKRPWRPLPVVMSAGRFMLFQYNKGR